MVDLSSGDDDSTRPAASFVPRPLDSSKMAQTPPEYQADAISIVNNDDEEEVGVFFKVGCRHDEEIVIELVVVLSCFEEMKTRSILFCFPIACLSTIGNSSSRIDALLWD